MSTPSRDDVWLCLHLYEQRRDPVLREARAWMADFCPTSFEEVKKVMDGQSGADANRFYRQAMSYWEMIAAMMNSGAISGEGRELFVQSTREWMLFWSKIAPFIEKMREATLPTAFGHLEAFCRSRPDYDLLMAYYTRMNDRKRAARTPTPKKAKVTKKARKK